MSRSMLINVTQEEESRVAIVGDGRLEWIEIETGGRDSLKGNIYKAVVENVNSSLQAAFVNFGGSRAGFLPFDEVNFRLLPARKRESSARASQDAGNRRTRISDHLKVGQEVLVQVVREAFATKPPTLSTFFSLPGRYLVLLPASATGGVSRKIDSEAGRERLKKILKQLEPKEGFGLIVRTAGFDQTKTALTRDLRNLMRLWTQVEKAAKNVKAPALIFRERDVVVRAIRDLYTPDISEVLIDGKDVYMRALAYVQSIMPSKQKLVKLYQEDRPLFALYDLEDQIENIHKRRVPLPSGGAIVIDETEALTSIDVNSGKTRESSIEETANRTNLEAAAEVARQLRLRDIGGLVVIDFIDMRTASYIRGVEKVLRESMKQDKARHDMTRISKLGLLEMSRQRLRATTMSSSYNTCAACEGNGVVKTTESAALSILRKIQTQSAQGDWARMRITLPVAVAEYLQNRKREELSRLEQRHRTDIVIRTGRDLYSHDSQIEVEHRQAVEEQDRRGRQASLPKVSHADIDSEASVDPVDDADAADESTASGGTRDEDGARSRRRRSSRGRRGGARSREATGTASATGGEAEPAIDALVPSEVLASAGEPSTPGSAADSPEPPSRRRSTRGHREGTRSRKTATVAPAASEEDVGPGHGPETVAAVALETTTPQDDTSTPEPSTDSPEPPRATRASRGGTRLRKAAAAALATLTAVVGSARVPETVAAAAPETAAPQDDASTPEPSTDSPEPSTRRRSTRGRRGGTRSRKAAAAPSATSVDIDAPGGARKTIAAAAPATPASEHDTSTPEPSTTISAADSNDSPEPPARRRTTRGPRRGARSRQTTAAPAARTEATVPATVEPRATGATSTAATLPDLGTTVDSPAPPRRRRATRSRRPATGAPKTDPSKASGVPDAGDVAGVTEESSTSGGGDKSPARPRRRRRPRARAGAKRPAEPSEGSPGDRPADRSSGQSGSSDPVPGSPGG